MDGGDDPFARLPKDLIFLIFQKLPNDLKFLIRSSLVSHLFASVTLQIPDVKLSIPSSGIKNLEKSRSQLMSGYARSTNWLRKFVQIDSLHLETGKYFAYWDQTAAVSSLGPIDLQFLSWRETDLWHDLLVKIIQDFPLVQSIGISNPYRLVKEVNLCGEELIKFKELNAAGEEDKSKREIIQSLLSRARGCNALRVRGRFLDFKRREKKRKREENI